LKDAAHDKVSVKKLGKEKLKGIGKAFEAALDRAVEHIISHADAKATEEGGCDLILDHEVGAVLIGKTCDNAVTGWLIHFDRTFHSDLAAFDFEAGQALECCENRFEIARLCLDEARDYSFQLRLIEAAIRFAKAE
jgi:hypothetical protein